MTQKVTGPWTALRFGISVLSQFCNTGFESDLNKFDPPLQLKLAILDGGCALLMQSALFKLQIVEKREQEELQINYVISLHQT